MGVGTKRRSQISKSLREEYATSRPNRGTLIRVHFCECCTFLYKVLDPHMRRGLRFLPFKFFSYEKGCIGNPASIASHVDLAGYEGNW